MGLRINYNGAAANAWRNLGINDANLSGSVAKLSSGLRINKGADDPAGLIISERLKAQITGLGQAVQNAQEATSLVQTAEGALTEMNNMLNKMRGLAVHASNSGVQDADSIAADQKQVDSALDSLQKIAVNTKFQAKTLLDGSASNAASIAAAMDGVQYDSIDVKGSADDVLGSSSINISVAAEKATTSGTNFGGEHGAGTLTITSTKASGEVTVNYAASATATAIADATNNFYEQTGVWASVSGGELQFTSSEYGSDQTFTVTASVASVIGSAAGAIVTDTGADADGVLSYTDTTGATRTADLTGDGLTLTVATSETDQLIGTEITLVGTTDALDDANRAGAGTGTGGNQTGADTDVFSVTEGALSFSLGQDASSDEMRTISIANMQITNIGKGSDAGGSSTLNSIRSGGTFDLANDAQNAIKIIDQAINDVSIARADLGAFQQNALETTIKTLNINKENLEASNSRITDVDMAQEMMAFTRSQILTQAGTAMLAQANQLPQSVLQLLG